MSIILKPNTMQDYINSIIKTGLANGVTLEQMMQDPDAAAKAHLKAQLDAQRKAAVELFKRS